VNEMTLVLANPEAPLTQDFSRRTNAKILLCLLFIATLTVSGCFISFAMIGLISAGLGLLNMLGVFGDGKLSQWIGMIAMVGSIVGLAGSLMSPGGGIGYGSDGFFMGQPPAATISGPSLGEYMGKNPEGSTFSGGENGNITASAGDNSYSWNSSGEAVSSTVVDARGTTVTNTPAGATTTYSNGVTQGVDGSWSYTPPPAPVKPPSAPAPKKTWGPPIII